MTITIPNEHRYNCTPEQVLIAEFTLHAGMMDDPARKRKISPGVASPSKIAAAHKAAKESARLRRSQTSATSAVRAVLAKSKDLMTTRDIAIAIGGDMTPTRVRGLMYSLIDRDGVVERAGRRGRLTVYRWIGDLEGAE